MAKTSKKHPKLLFRHSDTIGTAGAEDDTRFLASCFVETDALQVLRACDDARFVVVGRTGAGKTAVLRHIVRSEERVVEIRPESLALAYISNSTILRFLMDLGVHLEVFFKLLWRHVLTVELLKRHFDQSAPPSLGVRLRRLFQDKQDLQAIEYLEKWGKSFWEETEYRVKEITETLAKRVSASVELGVPRIQFTGDGRRALTKEQKIEVVERAQRVVNEVQVSQLADIVDLIDRVLDDPQKPYYVLIDRLDEDWVDDAFRYRLIRALIDTAKEFNSRIRHTKVIVALRSDLLYRVFKICRESGYQEEKFRSLYLTLDWSHDGLTDVLDKRIAFLTRLRGSTKEADHGDVFPKTIRKQAGISYFLDRTLQRPRDVILFFNECIKQADNSPRITADMLRKAEGEFSQIQYRGLGDEWTSDYPRLLEFAKILKGRNKAFSLGDISDREIEEFCLNAATSVTVDGPPKKTSSLDFDAFAVAEGRTSGREFVRHLFRVLHSVGMVGLKLETFETHSWTKTGRSDLTDAQLTDSTKVEIHPAFFRVLGINEKTAQ